MALNRKGILALADDLVAHKKRYDQGFFGMFWDVPDPEYCKTVCCLAGFCLSAEIGAAQFNKRVKAHGEVETASLKAAKKQLGVRSRRYVPQIFQSVRNWPPDLCDDYYANGPRGRVVVALKALQRLLPNGRIDTNPKAVHTRIPQLKALLAAKK